MVESRCLDKRRANQARVVIGMVTPKLAYVEMFCESLGPSLLLSHAFHIPSPRTGLNVDSAIKGYGCGRMIVTISFLLNWIEKLSQQSCLNRLCVRRCYGDAYNLVVTSERRNGLAKRESMAICSCIRQGHCLPCLLIEGILQTFRLGSIMEIVIL